MSEVVLERRAAAAPKTMIIDCDIHPAPHSMDDIKEYLPKQWQSHWSTYGAAMRAPIHGAHTYPRIQPFASRLDSWPDNGGLPGSDLAFMQKQHLDPLNIEYGMLSLIRPAAHSQRNLEFGAALCIAVNDWQRDAWTRRDKRLKASIVVQPDNVEAAVAEIRSRARDADFVQIGMGPRATEPLGRKRYWPIYAAAQEVDMPIAIHPGSISGTPDSGAGWPSFYIEDFFAIVDCSQSVLTSFALEGVFEKFPNLRIVLVEGGWSFVPSLCWRLDKVWERMRDELPHVKQRPSEYIKRQVWYTTQPMEEPANIAHQYQIMEWIGWDRLLFSSDYPHWDFDDPRFAIKATLSPEQRRMIMSENARRLYKL
jgi:hypothetical protein